MTIILEVCNILPWKPTIDRYVIQIFIQDKNLNKEFTCQNKNTNYIAYVTFQNTSEQNYITWNLKPNVDFTSEERWDKINNKLKKFKSQNTIYLKQLAENYFYNKYPNLL